MKYKKSLLKFLTVGAVLIVNPITSFAGDTDPDAELALQTATSSVANAEITRKKEDIETARDLVNKLEESGDRDALQIRLNGITPDWKLDRGTTTANVDVYIKSENMLLLALDTNTVTFEEFSGVQDIEKPNAVTLSVKSSLAYEVNSSLLSEITGAEGNTMDKSVLDIKANAEPDYQKFTAINTPINLLDNQPATRDGVTHGIDLKLGGDDAHKADIYKTVIKFEVKQK